ncbi:MAG: hypothetical protein KAF64_22790 [Hydrogenophaga sp.]|uniref:hypothetical protein n=1 Tax=Hydrogenophaga sp. TaxID=1904254 RepID=UPI0025C72053|nr:hypothetical protein [Hydrogenophaga sp.]MBU7576205.1 hypothetical protein [Hydrogenophaga sp.]
MPSHRLLSALAASALMLVPATSIGESVLAHQGQAGASLDFRIVIPPIMRVLENSHPQLLDTTDGEASAEQRLVVMSNMKRGFCVSLRRAAPQLGTWELQTAPQSGVQLSPVADGYRLCGTRPGQYTVLLQHRFGTTDSRASALHWPVQTDISAI